MGFKEKSIWLPMVIDVSKIVAIKENGHNDDEVEDLSDKAVIYIQNQDYFIIDITYENAVKAFKYYHSNP